MAEPRPTPWAMLRPALSESYDAIRHAVEQAGADPHDRDAFLLLREVVETVHRLRPEGGLGEAMEQFSALVHLSYLHWAAGEQVLDVSEATLGILLRERPGGTGGFRNACYVQYPPRRIWGSPGPESAQEPLDGCFVTPVPSGLDAVAVFGFHPGRAGFTAVTVRGPRPDALAREDGSPLFGPIMPGGNAAGLVSILGMEELLELLWRTDAALGQ